MAVVEHWIFAGTLSQARYHAMSQQLRNWRYVAGENVFRGVRLDQQTTVHILDTFADEGLESLLNYTMVISPSLPTVIDLRGQWDLPDLTDPAAVEAWLNA